MSTPSSSSPTPTTATTSTLKSLVPPPLSAYITDSTGHTILSTSSQSVQSLSHAYLSAHDTASRMGLGVPLRITVVTRSGDVVIQTGTEADVGEIVVATVVAPVDRMADARVASWGVEEVAGRVGKVIGEGRRVRG